MGGEICKQVGKERGPWFEIKCVKDIIISKEAKGQDAKFERGLLKSWSKYNGYESSKQALQECDRARSRTSGESKSGGF